MSVRLQQEVMFVENTDCRYELSLQDRSSHHFRWAKVLSPEDLAIPRLKTFGVPLSEDHVQVLHDGVKWQEIIWGHSSLEIRGQVFANLRVQFFHQRTDSIKT
jgi:hypothetical protein